MTRRFVGAARVTDESGEFDDGKIRDIGIFNHGSDKSALSKCAACGTFRENPGGVTDGIGADGAKAVATEESQRTPPTRSCAKQ
jgi:hypothetical protein